MFLFVWPFFSPLVGSVMTVRFDHVTPPPSVLSSCSRFRYPLDDSFRFPNAFCFALFSNRYVMVKLIVLIRSKSPEVTCFALRAKLGRGEQFDLPTRPWGKSTAEEVSGCVDGPLKVAESRSFVVLPWSKRSVRCTNFVFTST